ncbi:MAG: TetR family transcriptional regulator [Rhizobiaceae bacterium]|nr:TetR family transcriptional regulator [Rhizobiaceae bacterium]
MATSRRADAAASGGARERILEAADLLAHEAGPGHLALDAVAARAGVSKGGLLYHFPSKTHLLTALVDRHIARFEAEIDRNEGAGPGQRRLAAYFEASLEECSKKDRHASGALAAMVQNPEMLVPIRSFKRRMLDRLTAAGGDKAMVLLVFLALDGLRSMKLLDLDILTSEEVEVAVSAMRGLMVDT